MKKILFISRGSGGVNYHRILIPFLNLKKNDTTFEYDYDNNIDYDVQENVDKLFNYNIIVYNKTILPKEESNLLLINQLKEKGIKIFLDIDDYWVLEKTHFLYEYTKITNDKELILSNLKNADIVTTTNSFLKEKISKYNKNVFVLENGYDDNIIAQFKSKHTKSDKVRIGYIGGSAHAEDLKLLDGVTNLLLSDNQLKDKFEIHNCGFIVEGTRLKKDINKAFFEALDVLKIPREEILKELILNKFDMDKVKAIPAVIKEHFADKLFKYVNVKLEPKESPYYEYEKILTSNYKDISKQYINFLHEFKNEKYEVDSHYIRKWNKPVTEYLTFLDDIDIVLAPLKNTEFNMAKSNLKMIEAMTRKLPFVGSNILPYSNHFNGEIGILIEDKKNQQKNWYKALKKLILDKELRTQYGENLYNSYGQYYHMDNLNKKRIKLLMDHG